MIPLRDYQHESVEALRSGLGAGHRCQVLSSPTGSGKTVIAAELLDQALGKGTRAVIVVDRVALVHQTSARLAEFGIPHGIVQSQNTMGGSLPIQVCSAQTIEKRGFFPELDLLIVDECHDQRRFITEFIQSSSVPVIGLTATPFTKGLGKVYSNVVNVTTTDALVEDGYLAPIKAYAAVEIDMTGARVVAGEWTDSEVERRGIEITGDVVSNWVAKTHQHFGGPVKTLVFSATVNHGIELCRQFHAAGHNFQQVSYRDGNDEDRTKLIAEFRKPDSDVMGLVSCEALAKGFDVPDVLCGIGARPYRKSFSGHIQQIGRVMRPHPDKTFALWLDHSGNYLGFHDRMLDLFANGVDTLDHGEKTQPTRQEKVKETTDIACVCGYVLPSGIDSCPSCGRECTRKSLVNVRPGELVQVERPDPAQQKLFYRQVLGHAQIAGWKPGRAAHVFRDKYGTYPLWAWNDLEPVQPGDEVKRYIKHVNIKYAKRRVA